MDADSLLDWLFTLNLPVWLSGLALLVALIALALSNGIKQRAKQEAESLRQRVGILGREMDDFRIRQFNEPNQPGSTAKSSKAETASYLLEKEAYQQLWPQVWLLHDRLGVFLRAIESGEAVGEHRRDARNAALEARSLLNRYRPFCFEAVDKLVTQLIDTEIKAHLSACQYLDLMKEAPPSDHDRRIHHDKCHALYETDAKDMLDQLVVVIRERMLTSR
ncbi:hypothetical protein [Marinobacter sp. CHS3-4]|uniref:hypothetical protein n=1 Tax=Marinobacter sp. CHS3-4 TaxID=3045174 RepID=UPI0024B58A2A|nr:hypothetical protein [Marinobacter sp. CHS3-4]MDI9244789.1 hypothetical protein [Marinobacter sp. CHS3-4]